MYASFVFILFIIAFVKRSEGYRLNIQKWNYRVGFTALHCVDSSKESVGDSEKKQVNKGLTHIKYNKYAPSAEEAAGMTDEEFRGTIFRRMVSQYSYYLRNL